MKLNFVINENYLIVHTISSMDLNRFSSKKYKKDIITFQTFAWKKSKKCYNFLIGRLFPEDLYSNNIKLTAKELPKFLVTLGKSNQYKRILLQTQKYLKFCENQWNKNYDFTIKIIRELTGLKFNKTFTVYITHPSLRNGQYLGNNKIAWGHSEDWTNYSTVYLWHEILHSYFDYTNISHAIIELITDEELRIKLNKGIYPPFVGHKSLDKLKKKILPYWKKYLNMRSRDIKKFQRSLIKLKNYEKPNVALPANQ